MSSNSYDSKPIEEIIPILDKFKQNFAKQFGDDANIEAFVQKLIRMREEREEALFRSMFGHLTPKNIQDCINLIQQSGMSQDATREEKAEQNNVVTKQSKKK